MEEQPHFILRKWGSLYNDKCSYEDQTSKEDELWGKSGSPLPRHRGNPLPAGNLFSFFVENFVLLFKTFNFYTFATYLSLTTLQLWKTIC